MAPLELQPVHPSAPATPVRRVEADERRHEQPPQRKTARHDVPESDTVDADGHIDTHV